MDLGHRHGLDGLRREVPEAEGDRVHEGLGRHEGVGEVDVERRGHLRVADAPGGRAHQLHVVVCAALGGQGVGFRDLGAGFRVSGVRAEGLGEKDGP